MAGLFFSATRRTVPTGGTVTRMRLHISRHPLSMCVRAYGPWAGKLANEGEKLTLRSASSNTIDTLTYGVGVPWPTAARGEGSSMELINPTWPRTLPGSWRSSGYGTSLVVQARGSGDFFGPSTTWRYFKGWSEPSSPRSAWRELGFTESASWRSGITTIGISPGEVPIATWLSDMRNGYTTVYFRKKFTVANLTNYASVLLEMQYNDGFIAWINGIKVAMANVASTDLACTATALVAERSPSFLPFSITNYLAALRAGTNILAVQLLNVDVGNNSAFFNGQMSGMLKSYLPTPGRRNSSYATNDLPLVWDIAHAPAQPTAGAPVSITARISSENGVSNAVVWYQRVLPGRYIRLHDPAYATNWTAIALHDDGLGGDAIPYDTVFTAVLPAELQTHRALIRYRVKVTDAAGGTVLLPYADDPVPNLAYLCYNGIPAWQGAVRPGIDPVVTYNTNVMRSIQPYHLVATSSDVLRCTWADKYMGDDYRWTGTLVTADAVYDHVGFRARGGMWRYAMGKNMWKFKFPRGHEFSARNEYGAPLPVRRRHLNLRSCINMAGFLHRGEQGMFEAVGFRLFNLAGCPASESHWIQFRIIDDAAEQGASQYQGDFWGLYLDMEEIEGQFLDSQNLPDGNVYKMEYGGYLQNQGPTAVTDNSDVNAFMAGSSVSTNVPSSWWRTNVDLSLYFAYRTILEGIHHYDVDDDKNYYYYLNPEPVIRAGVTNFLWSHFPWDLDITWADNMCGTGEERFKTHGLLRQPDLFREYCNAVRSIRDLLFNTNEAWRLIDDCAALIDDPAGGLSFVDADRAMWDYNPVMVSSYIDMPMGPSQAGTGKFYNAAATHDFPGMVTLMKNYVTNRCQLLDSIAADAAIPNTPGIAYVGMAGYPADDLRFTCSAFADPQGTATFAALQWRIGEVTDTNSPAFNPLEPRKHEIETVWTSAVSSVYADHITVPAGAVLPDHTYRVRVRMKDTSDRWSHWSSPVEFVAGMSAAARYLRVTELMYHPPVALSEFIELFNTAPFPLVISNIVFSDGIDFMFSADSTMAVIGPTSCVVLVQDMPTFAARYAPTNDIPIAGQYRLSLANEGEAVGIEREDGGRVHSFAYRRTWWPTTDGGGDSLVINDVYGATGSWNVAGGWHPSIVVGGTPGTPDIPEPWVAPLALVMMAVARRWRAL